MSDANKLMLTRHDDRTLLITRRFEASPAKVFAAMTQPALVQQWLKPPGWTMPVCDIDFRPGGAYRYVWRNEAGDEMGVGGKFMEIAAPQRIVHDEVFEPAWFPGKSIITTQFLAEAGGTLLRIAVEYEAPEALTIVLASPMEQGMAQSYDQLAELLAG